MKALVKKYAKEGLWLEDMPEPEMGNNDVLVKNKKDCYLRHRHSYLQLG
jgi:threonine 3-dehydrogenase